ncbi:MAG: hypothetical protein CMJ86_05900, partial [Planctomycetes bacterium]|nr:hypothetical protein [Planctomycetota bacterium]
MPTLRRYLVHQTVGFTLMALYCLWPLALIVSLEGVLTRTNPLLAIRPGLAGGIAMVLSAPLVFALAAGAGVALLQNHLNATMEALVVQLNGVSPWRLIPWSLIPAAILSASSLFLLLGLHPAASRVLRGTAWLEDQVVPEMMATMGRARQFDHLAYSGAASDEGRVEDLRLLVMDPRGPSVAVGASRAEFQLAPPNDLQVDLEEGLLDSSVEGVEPIRFQQAIIEMNLRTLICYRQGRWAKPDSRNFSQLRTDARVAAKVDGERALAQFNRLTFEPYYRIALGLLPLSVAGQITIVLTSLWSFQQRRVAVFTAFMLI